MCSKHDSSDLHCGTTPYHLSVSLWVSSFMQSDYAANTLLPVQNPRVCPKYCTIPQYISATFFTQCLEWLGNIESHMHIYTFHRKKLIVMSKQLHTTYTTDYYCLILMRKTGENSVNRDSVKSMSRLYYSKTNKFLILCTPTVSETILFHWMIVTSEQLA